MTDRALDWLILALALAIIAGSALGAAADMSDRIALWPIHERPDLAAKSPVRAFDPNVRIYIMGHTRIILSHDPQRDGSRLWHISISCSDRDPTWQEIATARYRLLPDVQEMAMYLPPLEEYVNLHPFTFHLHEAPR